MVPGDFDLGRGLILGIGIVIWTSAPATSIMHRHSLLSLLVLAAHTHVSYMLLATSYKLQATN
jgi:hypothetical protein